MIQTSISNSNLVDSKTAVYFCFTRKNLCISKWNNKLVCSKFFKANTLPLKWNFWSKHLRSLTLRNSTNSMFFIHNLCILKCADQLDKSPHELHALWLALHLELVWRSLCISCTLTTVFLRLWFIICTNKVN